jgi:hypothetical protein
MAFLQAAANRQASDPVPLTIDHSVKLDDTNAEYLYKTFSAVGDRRCFTISFWHQRTQLGLGGNQGTDTSERLFDFWDGNSLGTSCLFTTDDKLIFDLNSGSNYATSGHQFRDPLAWYHIVLAVDTKQDNQEIRVNVYVNGEIDQTTYGNFNTYIPKNTYLPWNTANRLDIGRFHNNDSFVGGHFAEFHHVDGQQLEATDFGMTDPTTGQWIPRQYMGGHGNNGFHLDFDASGDLGNDVSGNNHDFSLNQLAAIDQSSSTPTNNFCKINSLVNQGLVAFDVRAGGTQVLTGGNMSHVGSIAVNQGKWYWEGVQTSVTGTNYLGIGISAVDADQGDSANPLGSSMTGWWTADNAYHESTSQSAQNVSYNTGWTGMDAGTIWSVALNCDTDPYTMTIRKNNSVPGTTANNTNRSVGTYIGPSSSTLRQTPVVPLITVYANSSGDTHHNFGCPHVSTLAGGNADANGYGNFKYAPPSGYYAICTKNLAQYGGEG